MSTALELTHNKDFLKVQGWMHVNVIKLLDAFASSYYVDSGTIGDHGASLEIGVHHGKMFLAIEAVTPKDINCYAVDVFDDQDSNIDLSGKGSLDIFTKNISQIALASERVVSRSNR